MINPIPVTQNISHHFQLIDQSSDRSIDELEMVTDVLGDRDEINHI